MVRDLAYAAPAADDPDAHTLDLYLPAAEGRKAPLLIFVAGHFWADRGGERSLGPHFTSVLQREGAAVALVRHRLAPEHRHPAAAQDVATAVAFLLSRADRFGFDRQRIYLGGHASGAHLAALVGLDPAYLVAQGEDPARLPVCCWSAESTIRSGYGAEPGGGSSSTSSASATPANGARLRRSGGGEGRAPILLLRRRARHPGYVPARSPSAASLRKGGREPAEVFWHSGPTRTSVLDLTERAESGDSRDVSRSSGGRVR